MAKILVVDDDAHIRELIHHVLKREGFDVAEAENGEVALRVMETQPADLVILDIMMPGMDGWTLCRELRELYDLPLLMLTALGETAQKVKGFDLGTDDYLVKPFAAPELLARVKALLKRYRIAASQQVQVGELMLDRQTFDCRIGREAITLPLKEFELLFLLSSYPGVTLLRDQLIEQVWGYDYEGDERTLDVHIKRLRDRFPEEKTGVKISTIRGLGYRMEVKG